MIANRYSGTDVVYSERKKNRSHSPKRNQWTIRSPVSIFEIEPRERVIRVVIKENTEGWGTAWIQTTKPSESTVLFYDAFQLQGTGDMDPWSSVQSPSLSGLNAQLKTTRYLPPQVRFDFYIATEQMHEFAQQTFGAVSADVKAPADLSQELSSIFELAAGEDFEDGVETEFSRRIEEFVRNSGLRGISLIEQALIAGTYREQYIAEALLWIGDMEHEESRAERRQLLKHALTSESIFVFDAAVSALSYLGDTSCIPALEETLEGVTFQPVRVNIENTIRYLRKLAE